MQNTGSNNSCGLSGPDINEDSVDIYDGLDISCCSSNAVKSPENALQLKESMDLYEEIVTEEQQSRESSYAELQSRFLAAQKQIKELHWRLEQLETQNTGLKSENCRLKKNISALLQTARQEVTRKDAEIQRLNQRSTKGRHPFHINILQDQTSSSLSSMCSSSSRAFPPPPLSSSSPLPHLPQPALTPKENQPSGKQSNNSTDQPTGSCIETRSSKASSHSHPKSLSSQQRRIDKHKSKHREENDQIHKLSQSTHTRYRTGSNVNRNCPTPEKIRSVDKDSGRKYESRSYKSKAKTGSSREHRQDKAKMFTSDSEHSTANSCKKYYSPDKRKIKINYEYSRNLHSKDPQYRNSSKDRDREGLSKDYHRKEAKRHEDEVSRKHKRSSLSETSREQEKQSLKHSDKDEVKICSKERQENKDEPLKGPFKPSKPTEKSSVQESTPNIKLCFMETLNLTLSPIKKPVIPIHASHDGVLVDKVVEHQPDEENSQPNVEDLFVIDEVDSSELEAASENVAEQSLDFSERTPNSCDDVKNTQEKDNSCSESNIGQPPKDNPVKTTSADSQALDIADSTVHPPPQSPQSSPKKLQNYTLENNDNSIKLASDSQVDESETLEAAYDDRPRSISEIDSNHFLHKANHGNNLDRSVAIIGPFVPESIVEPSNTTEKESLHVDSVEESVSPSEESTTAGNLKSQLIYPPVVPHACQEGPCRPASLSSIHKTDSCVIEYSPKDSDAISSTISLESFPQEGVSLPEAIYILTKTSEDAKNSLETEGSSSNVCVAVSKVSSTTIEMLLPEKFSDLTFTPKKSFSPRKSHENIVESSTSVPLIHDEDSMMQTLNNLKRFPDAISPLRSPVRVTKRSHLHVPGKPGHVKSLENDFSNTASNVNSKKLDVNKENKYPAKHDLQSMVDKVSDHPSSLSDTELEEGEILSESDEAASGSPVPLTKRAKLSPPVRNKPNHKTVLKRKSEDCCFVSKETSETAGASTRSPKSRFKTVCPAATKTYFSSVEEIMETFKLVRTEIRKKYMKLHKTFPKKSFYGMMDNFQESFLEFVEGAQFGQICSQAGELKSKLKKLIASVFSKVSNNGIVKRIFEQQAIDLKQKLWDFVDVQVDYLFKDIHMTLMSLCKPARAPANKDKRLSGNERASRQPDLKKQQCQQKDAKPTSTSLNRNKTCTVLPYKTGLGSRGKDIRITHMEKDPNVDSHPVDCQNTQTVVDFLPPKNIPSTPEKNTMVSLIVSQNGPLLDKTDFEILTEQQASSLTFNLVRDSQMGEIFKCLLQGSDLLESSGITEDHATWSLGTPKKDGERLISITTPTKFHSPSKMLSPTRFETPSKLFATWSSISPRKMLSPRSRDQISLNPALLDESCLLEVPSEKGLILQSSMASQKSYSILAEDLAVSLTIPSPLKSDSHLSFLQSSSTHIMSTPDSVISAHISEDALLDGEDATEQDIHLTLDTDNSSCCSSSSVASVALATSFVFQTDKPMQALVMEKSNDHFIVKIRQAATNPDVTLTADDSLNQTIREDDHQHSEDNVTQEPLKESQAKALLSDKSQDSSSQSDALPLSSGMCQALTRSEFFLTQDESLKLSNDPCHQKEDASIHQSTLQVSLPEESQSLKHLSGTATLQNSLHSGDYRCPQICQATTNGGVTVTVNESSTETLHGDMEARKGYSKSLLSEKMASASKTVSSDSNLHHLTESTETIQMSQSSLSHSSDLSREETDMSESERCLVIAEDVSSTSKKGQRDREKGRKRRKHQEKSKAKRSKKEEVDSAEEFVYNSKEGHEMSNSSPPTLSPNSLSAKNVVRKKGEVVIAWSRDEDRTILVDLKKKGPSRETFSALSEKLNKPSGQVAHRFYQLMKLFKKQEKMDT
ncbi:CASP8-associated protein 2 FLICE-associated huge protein [Channa argus]|uniref:CASP8-associated protein 2 n=1 Tax=Channa argus TaxID=215402 RepID=A0A6G1QK84_CHAAH|nr:CASP8-associated protein 2 FLICE-associated huge protein [Channa argus]